MNDERDDVTEKDAETTSEPEGKVEDRIGQGEILDELATLGARFGTAVQSFWESEQRKNMQAKVLEELKTAGEQVERIAERAKVPKPPQAIQEGAEKITRSLGDGLLAGLKALNRELSRTIEKHERRREGDEEE